MGKVGIFAFAFGQQGEENYPVAGPSNHRITMIAWRIYADEKRAGNDPMIAAQWETGIGLPVMHVGLLVSRFGTSTHYVDTKKVFDEGIAFFKKHDVERVILVGHPINLFFIKLLIESGAWNVDGITIDHQYDKSMKAVPYDKSPGNVQWWTRNPVAFIVYMTEALLTGKHGS